MKTEEQLKELRDIKIESYTYDLVDEMIAKFPLAEREMSKLLIYDEGQICEKHFTDTRNVLQEGQLLIFNNTKVIHARLFFKKSTGAVIEVFCLEPCSPVDYTQSFSSIGQCEWICMVGNLKKWKAENIVCQFEYQGEKYVLEAEKKSQQNGEVVVRFSWNGDFSFSEVLDVCGQMPIPPYLNRESEESDELRYQTIYSKEEGSVAAPTAGLHFTQEILSDLEEKGVEVAGLTLHVGAGTFRPVKAEQIGDHDMHTEHIMISRNLVEKLKEQKGEIIAVGTTSVRTLESLYWMGVKCLEGIHEFNSLGQWEVYALPSHYSLQESMSALVDWFEKTQQELLKAQTTIMIVPGYTFQVIGGVFTNFHQPQSTLLLLVGAAVGEDWRKIYDYALNHEFRFLSYGDSSLLKIKKQGVNDLKFQRVC